MWMMLIVGAIVLLVVILFYKELLISSFDPTMAAAYGLPTQLIHYVIMILLTMTTVASLQTVGVVLRSEEHTSELQSRGHLVCRLLLEKKNKVIQRTDTTPQQ